MNTSRLLALLVLTAGCGGAADDVPDSAADAGPDDAGPAAPPPLGSGQPEVPPLQGGCNAASQPAEDPCVLHESIGVFVSAQGNDANVGTRALPLRSLAKGMDSAKASGRRLYVCAETYAEPTLTLQQGVAVYGNLSCAGGSWAVTTQHATLASTATVAALAKDIATETRIEGLDLTAAAATTPGDSSIALIAEDAPGLHFVRSALVAQDGADGADGAAGLQFPEPGTSFDGAPAAPERTCAEAPGAIFPYTCNGAAEAPGGTGTCRVMGVEIPTNPGGTGGAAAVHKVTTTFGTFGATTVYERTKPRCFADQPCVFTANANGNPAAATAETNAGASATYGNTVSSIDPSNMTAASAGAPGQAGLDGAAGARIGQLSAGGYVPAAGAVGSNGSAGQGGGGGAGVRPHAGLANGYRTGRSGSGGGAGGCPGLAGSAGGGGGASIALLATRSPMQLETTVLRAGRGGVGGRGTLGSAPTAGGNAGVTSSGQPGPGAAGGTGGASGWSGPGGTGPSFAIVWSGAVVAPSADSKLEPAAPRDGQPALEGGGKTIPAALPGLAAAVYPME